MRACPCIVKYPKTIFESKFTIYLTPEFQKDESIILLYDFKTTFQNAYVFLGQNSSRSTSVGEDGSWREDLVPICSLYFEFSVYCFKTSASNPFWQTIRRKDGISSTPKRNYLRLNNYSKLRHHHCNYYSYLAANSVIFISPWLWRHEDTETSIFIFNSCL